MAFSYPPELRRRLCERMLAGERVDDLAAETGVTPVTLYRWKKQARIDAGLLEGTKSHEVDELARAQRRIKDLETELEMVKAATAIFNGEEVVRPKGSARS